ncbi:RNA polymerase sigma factor [Kosakonia radicincitans]|uniref:RNA polymerase sigma factor n=1 Tax=Kosakonia radicincitans TaxID=283686 RepID=UPI0005C2D8AD|nr:sigma-70 family RNA polymerase sigma factor [Kosakonia radicincitans]KIS45279.1 RNA polymerase sigma factor, sigma-70 family protein [Kosakonia radicincitans YD4]
MSALFCLEIEASEESLNPVYWEILMRENEKRLYNFIHKRVANTSDVEDLVQSTWLEVLCNCHRFRGLSKPETWMFGIALNLVKNHYKSLKVSYLHDELNDNVLTQSDLPDDITEYKDTLQKVLGHISRMPPVYQQILQLIVDHDISYQEVADELMIPVGTVRSRLSRLRQTLRNEVDWKSEE